MVEDALKQPGASVICWQHEDIPLENADKQPGISHEEVTHVAYDFAKMALTSRTPTMRNSFVLVQWHGESSVRETSLMI